MGVSASLGRFDLQYLYGTWVHLQCIRALAKLQSHRPRQQEAPLISSPLFMTYAVGTIRRFVFRYSTKANQQWDSLIAPPRTHNLRLKSATGSRKEWISITDMRSIGYDAYMFCSVFNSCWFRIYSQHRILRIYSTAKFLTSSNFLSIHPPGDDDDDDEFLRLFTTLGRMQPPSRCILDNSNSEHTGAMSGGGSYHRPSQMSLIDVLFPLLSVVSASARQLLAGNLIGRRSCRMASTANNHWNKLAPNYLSHVIIPIRMVHWYDRHRRPVKSLSQKYLWWRFKWNVLGFDS